MKRTTGCISAVLQAYTVAAFALAAGVFSTFYFVITPSLMHLEAHTMLSAMTSVNEGVRTPFFAATFFGAPLSCLGLCLLLVSIHKLKEATIWFIALSLYVFLVLFPTVLINVPINENLAQMGSFTSRETVRAQVESWHFSNGVRTIGSSAAFLMSLAMTLLFGVPRTRMPSLSPVD